jgi:hypothetical protein
MTNQIEAAAVAVAEARANGVKAHHGLIEAQGARKRLTDRLAAITSERAEIVAARRGGDADPEHGIRIEVLSADERDLAELVAEADRDVTKASGIAQEASGALARAEQSFALATDEAFLGRLTAHATGLDGLLLKTVTEIAGIVARRGGRPVWFPSIELANTLQRLHLTANINLTAVRR